MTTGRRLVVAMVIASTALALVPAASGRTKTDRIVYAANRSGRWDLYVANASGTSERRITSDPLDDISPDVSPDGKLVVFARGAGGIPQGPSLDLWIANLDGTGERPLLADEMTDDYMPKWSPDGRKVAFTRHPRPCGGFCPNEDHVFVIDVKTKKVKQLTTEGTYNGFPEWSPDGRIIAYQSTGNPPLASGIHLMSTDGTGRRRISPKGVSEYNASWSNDGKWIAFRSSIGDTEPEIWKMRPDGTGRKQLTRNGQWNGFPDWSPDDRHIAFHSTDGGCPGGTAGWAFCPRIWRINADGSSPTLVTSAPVGNIYVRYVPRAVPSPQRRAL